MRCVLIEEERIVATQDPEKVSLRACEATFTAMPKQQDGHFYYYYSQKSALGNV